ncbi:unnamed protein product, partial [Staurois parvus]
CRKLAFSSRFYQRFKCKAANRVYKRLYLKNFFELFQFPMLSRAFFHHEKCMQSVFKVLKWTKH